MNQPLAPQSLSCPTRFVIEEDCLNCALCGQIAPQLFGPASAQAHHCLRPPQTPQELALAQEALAACPTEAILQESP